MSAESSSFSSLTTSFTQWPDYQDLEKKKGACIGCKGWSHDWPSADQLTPQALENLTHLKRVSEQTVNTINSRPIFQSLPHVSLVEQQQLATKKAASKTEKFYQRAIEPLKKNIHSILKVVAELAKNKILFEYFDFKKLHDQCAKAAEDLSLMQALCSSGLMAAQNDPRSKDSRCDSLFLEKLEPYYLQNEEKYSEIIKQEAAVGKINPEHSKKACWKWQGQLLGLQKIQPKIINLSHLLHESACCLDALKQNGGKEDFWIEHKPSFLRDVSSVRDFLERSAGERWMFGSPYFNRGYTPSPMIVLEARGPVKVLDKKQNAQKNHLDTNNHWLNHVRLTEDMIKEKADVKTELDKDFRFKPYEPSYIQKLVNESEAEFKLLLGSDESFQKLKKGFFEKPDNITNEKEPVNVKTELVGANHVQLGVANLEDVIDVDQELII